MNEILVLASQFRAALDKLHSEGYFQDVMPFDNFPTACCGNTSLLLGHHLLKHNISTDYVCGFYSIPNDGAFSHAWLRTSDGIVIDITGDQFKNNEMFLNYGLPVYVGPPDDFHQLFEVHYSDVRETVPLQEMEGFLIPWLEKVYRKIEQELGL